MQLHRHCWIHPTETKFDEYYLTDVLSKYPLPFVSTGDFNAHNSIWGSIHVNPRGRKLADIATGHHLFLVNDGSPTYIQNLKSSSCLDIRFVSPSLASRSAWFADIEFRAVITCLPIRSLGILKILKLIIILPISIGQAFKKK